MRLIVANETSEAVSVSLQGAGTDANCTNFVPSRSSFRTTSPGLYTSVRLEKVPAREKYGPTTYLDHNLFVMFPLKLGSKWKSIRVPSDCPWRIYRSQVSQEEYRITIFSRRNLASFLSDMPDTLPLSSLLLPGTHDTMAFYGWPISQCQSLSTPLSRQLHSGIRILDIRLAVIHGRLIAYHGVYPQRTPFQDILRTIHDFLTASESCREAIVMSIKQEDFMTTPLPLFSKCVHDEIMAGPGGRDMWFLENRIPKLGEVRGKVIMLSRFGGDGSGWEGGLEGLGIHPTAWPDSEKDGFTWTLKGTLVRTHDWYNIPSFLSIPEKTQLATEVLLPPPNDPPMPVLNITFFSAASFPLAFPPTIARGFGWPKLGLGVEGVNGRVGTWLLDMLSSGGDAAQGTAEKPLLAGKVEDRAQEPPADLVQDVRIRGWAFMDFYSEPDDAVVPLFVECNFRGRRRGEEGWQ